MSHWSSSSVRNRGSPVSRAWQGSTVPRLGAGRPLEVVPPPEIDDVTGLPLVVCPHCRDLKLTAFTCRWTRNRGNRFFKCPRNEDWVANRCGIIMNQAQYENYLQGKNDAVSALMGDGAPPQLIEEIEQVQLEVSELKEELALVKLGMDEMKKTEPRKKTPCVVVFSVLFVVMCIAWAALK
ncbi:unnamed protein product [Urochloa decumbens]|uniref:Zinc finger GRF-type domain-containing protein n=1 Tax=Urochloa decumbens TaxID=240449 RepID=A0ABC9DT27_9POAL